MIEVTAAIIEDNYRIMIARRKAGKHLTGYWEFPGGKIEENESSEQCPIREIKEEFLVELEVREFILESVFNYSKKDFKLLGYRCITKHGVLYPQDHDKIECITFQEIFNFKIAPADIPLIEFYGQKRNP
jgi:mutator protein MutT